ncbi:hypothetical protein SPBR_07178 [Sporothrix brasiliensis 5110]|uniref:Uncharacterized protein n=1 Tax=Sporothrix brasiliensis 5110 TaxID=1398154 RepID=A0A0C2II42_9PEZI|nr:uncharacterized protein SPBR_07178 [Sporothrix brasiliensis 5110]KIH88866.1 hypothetical protein SPBR_07178 [Sporothrix brasiliensis 5110]
MASKTLSPGAALLRTSRLFSLPVKPVPQAPSDVSDVQTQNSDRATKPFPTFPAIRSPRSSRKRGDWGLKRRMPDLAIKFRSIRVYEHDTIEGITDYAHAHDHTTTLRKWQSLNMPLTSQTDAEQRQHIAGKSVFDEDADVIAIDPSKRHTPEDKRWKFEGPWLAGITEGDFQTYLKKKVRTRRPEFREFLRTQLAADKNATAAADAMDRGGADAAQTLTAADITDEQLTEYLRVLRHDRPLLYRLVGKFLDLAPVEPTDKIYQNLARSTASLSGGFLSPLTGLGDLASSASSSTPSPTNGPAGNPWARDGPPMSHPSAGLTYLRTAAFLDNHPVYGPQKFHPPVQSRVIQPRTSSNNRTAKLGVAGIVASSPFSEAAYSNTRHNPTYSSNRAIPGLSVIDPSVYGGFKIPVHVAAAKVNSQGRIMVQLAEADPEATLVRDELEGKEIIYGQPSRLESTRADSQPRSVSGRFILGRPVRPMGLKNADSAISSAESYGLS